MSKARFNPMAMVLAGVAGTFAVLFVAYTMGYASGKDRALKDNRADAALEAQQNREG